MLGQDYVHGFSAISDPPCGVTTRAQLLKSFSWIIS